MSGFGAHAGHGETEHQRMRLHVPLASKSAVKMLPVRVEEYMRFILHQTVVGNRCILSLRRGVSIVVQAASGRQPDVVRLVYFAAHDWHDEAAMQRCKLQCRRP